MSNPDDKPLPTPGDESDESVEHKRTLQGIGDLKLPRPRQSTVMNPRPQIEGENDGGGLVARPDASNPVKSTAGWESIPLGELSIPSPAGISRPTPESHEDSEVDEFEDEKTQMSEGLGSQADDAAFVDEFEDEATRVTEAGALLDDDAALHEERVGFASTLASPAVDASSEIAEINSAAPSFRTDALPLPAPIVPATPAASDPDASDDFQSEKTEVLQSPFESEAPVGRLLVLEGPNAGQEFFVTGMRNTLGRGENNSIMVADSAMSRQHLEIIKNPDDTYTLRDLQSANGTGLNGTRVREADLFHGDRVEAGKSVMQFIIQGAVQPPSRNRRLVPAAMATMSGAFPSTGQPPAQIPVPAAASNDLAKLSTIITVLAGIVSVILLIGIVFLLTQSDKTESAASPQDASQLYLAGVDAVKNREWTAARAKFEEAKTLDPKLSIDPQLQRIEREEAAAKVFAEIREAFDKEKYDRVSKLAATIPDDSAYREEAQALAKTRKKFEVDEIYASAQSMVTDEDFEGARTAIDRILNASPNHRGALELKDRIVELEREKADQAELAIKSKKVESAPFELVESPKSKPKRTVKSSKILNLTDGYKLYDAKEFDRAAKFFDKAARGKSGSAAAKSKKTATSIRAFAKDYKTGKRAYAIKKWSDARTALKRAYRSDAAVSPQRKYHRSEVAKMLAIAEANLGRIALEKGRYGTARKHLGEAEAYGAKESTVRDLRRQVQAKAKALYIKAVNLRKTDAGKAAKLCRNIMALTPASDGTHQKAKKILSEL